MPHNWLYDKTKVGPNVCTETKVGHFHCIYDESQEKLNKRLKSANKGAFK